MLTDFIPLIIWIAIMIYCSYWVLSVLKTKIKYEISEALALAFYFTAALLGQYFELFYQNLFLTITGFVLIFIGIFIFISQVIIMKKYGQGKHWEDTSVIIMKGWFKYMRHPMYFGLAVADIGVIIWIPSFFSIIFALLSFILCLMSSIWEDKINITKFGDAYKEFMEKVKLWGIF
ncbi:MAG: methyltransferase family protein [Promethearchaeota archaeon]